jgi:hypothetical protein
VIPSDFDSSVAVLTPEGVGFGRTMPRILARILAEDQAQPAINKHKHYPHGDRGYAGGGASPRALEKGRLGARTICPTSAHPSFCPPRAKTKVRKRPVKEKFRHELVRWKRITLALPL